MNELNRHLSAGVVVGCLFVSLLVLFQLFVGAVPSAIAVQFASMGVFAGVLASTFHVATVAYLVPAAPGSFFHA